MGDDGANRHTLTLPDRQCAQAVRVAGGLRRLLLRTGTKARVGLAAVSSRSVGAASEALLRRRGGLRAPGGSSENPEADMSRICRIKYSYRRRRYVAGVGSDASPGD